MLHWLNETQGEQEEGAASSSSNPGRPANPDLSGLFLLVIALKPANGTLDVCDFIS